MKIHQDERNYRDHSEENKSIIKKSVDELGAGRSILLDNSGKIIAGNGVQEQWGDRPVRVIETDGSELIAVLRKDLAPDDPKRQKLAFADNHSSDLSTWNIDSLRIDQELLDLEDWKFDTDVEGFMDPEEEKEMYTRNITSPHYEPSERKPPLSELVNAERVASLLTKIDKSNLDQKEKEFLKLGAYRLLVFNYSKIADYYAHSEKETQEIMEEMALVIIDFKKAVELGYVKLSNQIADQYKEEHDE